MDVLTAISERQSVRAYLDKPVSIETVEAILKIARWAPSGTNTQPWQVLVLGQATMKCLGDAIISAIDAGSSAKPDYHYYPETWFDPYLTRRKACGLALYQALEIEKNDEAKRKAQWLKNYRFFGAPCGLLFIIDSRMQKGSWMDMGMFLQNVMLAARGFGLETCAQASLADWPDLIRQHCQLETHWHVVCGMSMGYADWANPVNQYRTERAELSDFVRKYP